MKETFEDENIFGTSGLKTKTMSLATGLNKLNMTRRPSFGRGNNLLNKSDCWKSYLIFQKI